MVFVQNAWPIKYRRAVCTSVLFHIFIYFVTCENRIGLKLVHFIKTQPLKLKFLLGRQMGTNFFWFRETFPNQVASFKILGAMAAKLISTW